MANKKRPATVRAAKSDTDLIVEQLNNERSPQVSSDEDFRTVAARRVEQANNERSPQWLVDKLEAAAKEILGKYSVEVDVSRNPMKPKYVTKSSAEWPFRLPKWPAGTKPKDIRQADDARDLMRHLRDLKSLLADRSDKTRDLTIAVAVMAGIKAGVMALGHVVEESEAAKQKMRVGKTAKADSRKNRFKEFYLQATDAEPGLTDYVYYRRVHKMFHEHDCAIARAAGKPEPEIGKVPTGTYDRYKRQLGLTSTK